MRLSFWKIGLLCIGSAALAGANCGTSDPALFPKTTTWNLRTVNSGANVRPAVVAVADFDADGRQDIAAGYPGTDTVTAAVFIFFQTDVDTFSAVQLAGSTDLTGVAALAVGDLDADGRNDLIAACDGRLVYLHSPADPRQAADWAFSTIDGSTGTDINQWSDVAVGDIDGQNGPDIVACNENIGRLSWFQAPAGATTGTGWTRDDIDALTRSGAAAVALEDIDGDGRTDVYSTASGEASARLAWYKNPTDPVGSAWPKITIGNLSNATRLAVGDLNGDTRNDVVATNPTGRQVGWYVRPTNPSGNWTGYRLTLYTTNTPTDVKIADIDGNGQLDVVVATQQSGGLRWFTPISSATTQWYENNLRDLNETLGRIALADIDADNRPDVIAPLLASTSDQDSIVWLENPEP